jgi:hypothetical protein
MVETPKKSIWRDLVGLLLENDREHSPDLDSKIEDHKSPLVETIFLYQFDTTRSLAHSLASFPDQNSRRWAGRLFLHRPDGEILESVRSPTQHPDACVG